MSKLRHILLAATAVAALVGPVGAAGADQCGPVSGVARLQVFDVPSGGLLGRGAAIVNFDGNWQFATFDETAFVVTGPGTADVTLEWQFAEGDATFLEHSAPVDIPGTNLQRFRSPVDVSPAGNAFYNGIYNRDTLVAWFTVRGSICVSA